ncbi:hypothetical protein [Sphingobacterium faecium]|uniref:hypothetical protein n=1 Tax=Sphingobacterium faecium TaxID=34087 RepID=UPI0024688371|nr:hypothetical protein [Sphingobacterium faecium]MDH5827692.1 hypothetical protein [Sphingobacterium faecium]
MKRILLALLIGGATLTSLSSCTKEYITNQNFLPGVTHNVALKSSDWKFDGTSRRIFVRSIPFKEIDTKYYDFGQVAVAISFDEAPDFFINIPAFDVPTKRAKYNFRVEYSYTDNKLDGVLNIYAEDTGISTAIAPPDMVAKVTLSDADDGGN